MFRLAKIVQLIADDNQIIIVTKKYMYLHLKRLFLAKNNVCISLHTKTKNYLNNKNYKEI